MSDDALDVIKNYVEVSENYMLGLLNAHAQLLAERAAAAKLRDAAFAYANNYMRDEADEHDDFSVCGPEQKELARSVFTAIQEYDTARSQP